MVPSRKTWEGIPMKIWCEKGFSHQQNPLSPAKSNTKQDTAIPKAIGGRCPPYGFRGYPCPCWRATGHEAFRRKLPHVSELPGDAGSFDDNIAHYGCSFDDDNAHNLSRPTAVGTAKVLQDFISSNKYQEIARKPPIHLMGSIRVMQLPKSRRARRPGPVGAG